jgi:hypothetical protein
VDVEGVNRPADDFDTISVGLSGMIAIPIRKLDLVGDLATAQSRMFQGNPPGLRPLAGSQCQSRSC